jgi:hypothetical protein
MGRVAGMTTRTYPVTLILPANTKACVESGKSRRINFKTQIKATYSDSFTLAVALLFGSEMTVEEILALDWSK